MDGIEIRPKFLLDQGVNALTRKAMAKRFTYQELHHLRNDLSIEALIKALQIPYRQGRGLLFRFQCPQCFGYHTAINPKTNLARCFDCRQNFNAIELAMLVKQLSFVEGVKFLQKHQFSPPKIRSGTKPTSAAEVLQQIALAAKPL